MSTDPCSCGACKALAAEYEGDSQLLAFYRKKLLVKGWAGRKSATEKAYILAHALWAQAAVDAGARTRLHLSNCGAQTVVSVGVVPGDVQPATPPLGGAE